LAMEWIKHVDGITKFPKLPVHLRNYREHFDRNKKVENAYKEARTERELLSELNEKLLPSPTDPNKEAPNEDPPVAQNALIENPLIAHNNVAARNCLVMEDAM